MTKGSVRVINRNERFHDSLSNEKYHVRNVELHDEQTKIELLKKVLISKIIKSEKIILRKFGEISHKKELLKWLKVSQGFVSYVAKDNETKTYVCSLCNRPFKANRNTFLDGFDKNIQTDVSDLKKNHAHLVKKMCLKKLRELGISEQVILQWETEMIVASYGPFKEQNLKEHEIIEGKKDCLRKQKKDSIIEKRCTVCHLPLISDELTDFLRRIDEQLTRKEE